MTPAWIPDIFAAFMLAVAAVGAARIAAARPHERGFAVTSTDVAHLVMGIAMAGMLASGLATLPDGAWEIGCWLLTAWFACLLIRDTSANGARALAAGHWAPHLIHSAAMVYMLGSVVAPVAGRQGTGAMGGPSGPAMRALTYPALALAFALILAGYAVWDLDQLSGGRYRPATTPVVLAGAQGVIAALPGSNRAGREFLLSPGTTVGCRIVMSVAMAYMLLIMI